MNQNFKKTLQQTALASALVLTLVPLSGLAAGTAVKTAAKTPDSHPKCHTSSKSCHHESGCHHSTSGEHKSCHSGHHHHHHHGFLMDRLVHQLDLTNDQEQAWNDIKAQTKADTKDLKESLHTKMHELLTITTSPNGDKDAAMAKLKEIQAIHEQLGEKMMNSWFEMRSKLTPEQAPDKNADPKPSPQAPPALDLVPKNPE